VFGTQAEHSCIAVHPSDLCTGLATLGAEIEIARQDGSVRMVPIADYHRLPGGDATRETTLRRDELVRAILVSPELPGMCYVKAPEEGFALASAGVRLRIDGGVIASARIVLGGVAHKPWPSPAAETALLGSKPDSETFQLAATAALAGIATDVETAFRARLIEGVLIEALEAATERAERPL
jgi:xanthine dehydrogenase YagS FAD-binding subunit